MRVKSFLAAGLALMPVLIAGPAMAAPKKVYTYSYTGVAYDTSSSPYTASDSVSFSFSRKAPLAPSTVYQVNTLGNATPAGQMYEEQISDGVYGYPRKSGAFTGTIVTDANGTIVQWSVDFKKTVDKVRHDISTGYGPNGHADTASVVQSGTVGSARADTVGTWTVTTGAAAAVAPSAESPLLKGLKS
jgi:hypothetical protein